MGVPLAEYRTLRPIRESARSRVYEAVSERDSRLVVAKVFDIQDENDEDRVEHEFELIRSLELEGVVRALELRRVGNQLVLLLEHVPGVNLAEFAKGRPLALEEFWSIAIQTTEILARTHAARVIHRDIKPANILIDSRTDRVCLADFGISVLLESERRHIYDDDVFVGTLPYISPEQTGRTGRTVDFRSDLYSLGVTFYELLTGRRPFESAAPLELIHAHLAREPVPPVASRTELPPALSRVVMKLLAKAPEARYQTASGLAADLRQLEAMWREGRRHETFELGREDFAPKIRLPHRLIGREEEAALLRELFESVIQHEGRETVVLTGPAGVGKSSVVTALEATVVSRSGYLVRSSFERGSDAVLGGFNRALDGVFEQILTESDARLGQWRRLLGEGLGGLAPVIAEGSPNLELIIGEQPVPAPLPPTETQNRWLVALERTIAAVAGTAPLVLVLDDVHAATHGTVRVLDALVRGVHGPVLIVLSLQLDELEPRHPMRSLVAELDELGHAQLIELGGLGTEAIAELLAAALPGVAEREALARLVARKTHGIPLFINQMLVSLAEAEALRPTTRGWVWDRAAVEAAPIPDDAVVTMQQVLAGLDEAKRDLISRAACIGPSFELPRLMVICERPRDELGPTLVELEEAGLLTRAGSTFRFTHETIRVAAQAELGAEERRALHWALGTELLATFGDSAEYLFEIADHLQQGTPIRLEPEGRLELASLDLRAGRRALGMAAYDLAHRYLSHGLEQIDGLEVDAASAHAHDLRFELLASLADTYALAGRRDQADAAFAELLDWELDQTQYGQVAARRATLLWCESRQHDAAELGLGALERLGISVPRTLERAEAVAELSRAHRIFRELDHAALDAMPRCEDELGSAICELVAVIKDAVFVTDVNTFLYLAGLHALLTTVHGVHRTTPKALSYLAIGVSGALDEVRDAVHLFELGQQLARNTPGSSSAMRVLGNGGALCLHRGIPFAELIARHNEAYPEALESGEFDSAGFLGGFGADMQLETGTHLHVLDRRCSEIEADVGRTTSTQMQTELWLMRGVCRALSSPTSEPPEDDEVWNLDPNLLLAQGRSQTNFAVALIAAALVELVLGEDEAALATCLQIAPRLDEMVFNTFYVARGCVLTCAAYYSRLLAGDSVQLEVDAVVRGCLATLTRWARGCPANYGHYLDLAEGLREATEGHESRAFTLLDRAWTGARRHGCRWIEGLAAEQLAASVERQGLVAAVDGLRVRAWDAFAAWGAEAKLRQLARAHPALFAGSAQGRLERPLLSTATCTPSSGQDPFALGTSTPRVDFARVLRSIGAISEDLRLEEVIGRVLDAALTTAGADHGLLILDRGGELSLVAEVSAGSEPEVLATPPLLREVSDQVPISLIHLVTRTGKSVVLDDAREDLRFAGDRYLEQAEVRSLLALPLVKGERRLGVLVLENHLTTHGFGANTIEGLRLITNQAVSTLENAQLYGALRRSEARWRSLVDGAPDLIALFDERGALVFRNQKGPLRGLHEDEEREEAQGVLERDSRQRWREAMTAVLERGERRELELRYLPRRGPPRWYAVRLAPIEVHRGLGEEGAVERNAVAVATDISARKRAETEKRALEAQLRQQQRLESLGTLASGVAHEINNPIQGIMNYADLIGTRSEDRELVVEFAEEIGVESLRVAKIVRNLLAFSRQDTSEEPEPVELGEIIEASLALLRSILRSDQILVEFELIAASSRVLCRPQQIQQVIMNLVTNARDALREAGLDSEERRRVVIRVEAAARTGWIEVSVRDRGPGIPDEVLPRIFDPFFTTKGRDQGTGLGLAVSHGIIRDHGGELRVDTVVGEGTCVSFMLPTFEEV